MRGWGQDVSIPRFVTQALMVESWGKFTTFSYNLPAWSISDEWFAYLLFPWLLPLFRRVKPLNGFVFALALFVAMTVLAPLAVGKNLTELSIDFGILRIIPEFCLGIALYRWRITKNSGWSIAFCAIAIVIPAALVGGQFDIAAILGFGFLILLAAQGRQISSRVLIYLGEISYSFYMIHFLTLFAAWRIGGDFGHRGLWIAAAFPVTIALSAVLYEIVEKPARRHLRHLSDARA